MVEKYSSLAAMSVSRTYLAVLVNLNSSSTTVVKFKLPDGLGNNAGVARSYFRQFVQPGHVMDMCFSFELLESLSSVRDLAFFEPPGTTAKKSGTPKVEKPTLKQEKETSTSKRIGKQVKDALKDE